MSALGEEPRPRQFRVSLARTVFAEIQVEALSPAAAREIARQRHQEATRKFATEIFDYRTETIDRMLEGKPVWVEVT